MPKITDQPLETVLIRFFAEDLEFIRANFGKNLGVNRAVRTIVHTFVTQAKATAATTIDELERSAELADTDVL
jgi:hypothetical protein